LLARDAGLARVQTGLAHVQSRQKENQLCKILFLSAQVVPTLTFEHVWLTIDQYAEKGEYDGW
jgi:hypothetical protein